MSTRTQPIRIDVLRDIARDTAAGLSDATIATRLNAAGVVLPRDAAFDHRSAPSNGYNLPTDATAPNRWSAASVAAVKGAAEYSPTNGYAAARAHGSDVSTPLTV